jgi:hypothetical protein
MPLAQLSSRWAHAAGGRHRRRIAAEHLVCTACEASAITRANIRPMRSELSMNVTRSLWASNQGDPVFMRRVNGWLTVCWVASWTQAPPRGSPWRRQGPSRTVGVMPQGL